MQFHTNGEDSQAKGNKLPMAAPKGLAVRCLPRNQVGVSVTCSSSLSIGKCLFVLAMVGFLGWMVVWEEEGHDLPPPDHLLRRPLRSLRKATGRMSKLADAMQSTDLRPMHDHRLCGSLNPSEGEVAQKTFAIVAISYRSPLSLLNSMRSWKNYGLLDVADEKILFLNSPTKRDMDIGHQYGFRILTTKEHRGNVMVGPALAYAVGNATSDYILLMEKDFELISDRETMMKEMYAGVQHLARGVDLYRLRGKTDHPAEGMPDCCAGQCPFNSGWKTAGSFADHMNWLFVYCDPDVVENSNGRVAQCMDDPKSLCYTSAESNWSNNPVRHTEQVGVTALFGREWFNKKLRDVSLHGKDVWTKNNMYEFDVMLEWLPWHPPAIVCSSYQGIFRHHEIDQ